MSEVETLSLIGQLSRQARSDVQRALELSRSTFVSTIVLLAGLLMLDSASVRALGWTHKWPTAWVALAIGSSVAVLTSVVNAKLELFIYRLILLDEQRPSWSPFLLFVTWIVGLSIPAYASGVVFGLAVRFGGVLVPGSIALLVVTVVVFVRLSLVLPAIAVSEPTPSPLETLRTSWNRTRGFWWTLVLSGILAGLPIILPLALIEVAIRFVLIETNSDPVTMDVWIRPILRTLIDVTAAAMGAAVAANLYRLVIESARQT